MFLHPSARPRVPSPPRSRGYAAIYVTDPGDKCSDRLVPCRTSVIGFCVYVCRPKRVGSRYSWPTTWPTFLTPLRPLHRTHSNNVRTAEHDHFDNCFKVPLSQMMSSLRPTIVRANATNRSRKIRTDVERFRTML